MPYSWFAIYTPSTKTPVMLPYISTIDTDRSWDILVPSIVNPMRPAPFFIMVILVILASVDTMAMGLPLQWRIDGDMVGYFMGIFHGNIATGVLSIAIDLYLWIYIDLYL